MSSIRLFIPNLDFLSGYLRRPARQHDHCHRPGEKISPVSGATSSRTHGGGHLANIANNQTFKNLAMNLEVNILRNTNGFAMTNAEVELDGKPDIKSARAVRFQWFEGIDYNPGMAGVSYNAVRSRAGRYLFTGGL